MSNTIGRWWAALRPRRGPVAIAVLVVLALVAGVGVYRTTGWAQYAKRYEVVDVDLAKPDVLIRTSSLSSLTRDLLKVPIARDLLTEDFVFYYEMHPDRLGLSGVLRRISYEHDVSWTDRMLASVFDEPAEVSLWHGPKGALDYWAIAMSRGTLGTLFQEAATIATKDKQLSVAGELDVDGSKVTVYALEYGAGRTFLIAARGDRLVVLSHPGMLKDDSGAIRPQPGGALARLLSRDEARRAIYRDAFPSDSTPAPVHSIIAGVHYLSFGYQRFFPGLEAVRFDFGGGQWATHVLLNGATLPASALDARAAWATVPANPAFCSVVPVDWAQGATIAAPAVGAAPAAALAAPFEGPAVVCWYEQGRVHTPLVAATLKSAATPVAPLVTKLFDWAIRKPEKAPVLAAKTTGDETVWQRELTVPFSTRDAVSGRPEPGTLRVTLAAKGKTIFFSPDGEQVKRALATVSRQYPSVADTLTGDETTLALVSPKALAALGRQESLYMLPRTDEPVFRAAAEARLIPRLDAVAKYPAYRLVLTSARPTGRGWQAVRWVELGR